MSEQVTGTSEKSRMVDKEHRKDRLATDSASVIKETTQTQKPNFFTKQIRHKKYEPGLFTIQPKKSFYSFQDAKGAALGVNSLLGLITLGLWLGDHYSHSGISNKSIAGDFNLGELVAITVAAVCVGIYLFACWWDNTHNHKQKNNNETLVVDLQKDFMDYLSKSSPSSPA